MIIFANCVMKKSQILEILKTIDDPCVSTYVREVYRIGYLSKQRRNELLETLLNASGEEFIRARNELVCHCLPIVIDSAFFIRERYPQIPLADLIQEGNYALIKGAEALKSKDCILNWLSLYRYFQNNIFWRFKAVKDNWNLIRKPPTTSTLLKSILNKWENQCDIYSGSVPFEYVVDLFLFEKNSLPWEDYKYIEILNSLYNTQFIDYMAIDETADDDYFYWLEYREITAFWGLLIRGLLNRHCFSERARDLVEKFYFEDIDLDELACEFGITRTRVRQILDDTIKKIRRKLHCDISDQLLPIPQPEIVDC